MDEWFAVIVHSLPVGKLHRLRPAALGTRETPCGERSRAWHAASRNPCLQGLPRCEKCAGEPAERCEQPGRLNPARPVSHTRNATAVYADTRA